MADDNKNAGLGKSWKGQTFVPVKTVEGVQADADAQKAYDKPGAITIEAYFAMKGQRNPVHQAMMRTYTNIKRATVEDWDTIFASF